MFVLDLVSRLVQPFLGFSHINLLYQIALIPVMTFHFCTILQILIILLIGLVILAIPNRTIKPSRSSLFFAIELFFERRDIITAIVHIHIDIAITEYLHIA